MGVIVAETLPLPTLTPTLPTGVETVVSTPLEPTLACADATGVETDATVVPSSELVLAVVPPADTCVPDEPLLTSAPEAGAAVCDSCSPEPEEDDGELPVRSLSPAPLEPLEPPGPPEPLEPLEPCESEPVTPSDEDGLESCVAGVLMVASRAWLAAAVLRARVPAALELLTCGDVKLPPDDCGPPPAEPACALKAPE